MIRDSWVLGYQLVIYRRREEVLISAGVCGKVNVESQLHQVIVAGWLHSYI